MGVLTPRNHNSPNSLPLQLLERFGVCDQAVIEQGLATSTPTPLRLPRVVGASSIGFAEGFGVHTLKYFAPVNEMPGPTKTKTGRAPDSALGRTGGTEGLKSRPLVVGQ